MPTGMEPLQNPIAAPSTMTETKIKVTQLHLFPSNLQNEYLVLSQVTRQKNQYQQVMWYDMVGFNLSIL